MKRSFIVAVGVAAFAAPALAPLSVLAQDGQRRGDRRGAVEQNGGEERRGPLPDHPSRSENIGGRDSPAQRQSRLERSDQVETRPDRSSRPDLDRRGPGANRPDRLQSRPDLPGSVVGETLPNHPDRPEFRPQRPTPPVAGSGDALTNRPDGSRGHRDGRDDRLGRRDDRSDYRRDRRGDRRQDGSDWWDNPSDYRQDRRGDRRQDGSDWWDNRSDYRQDRREDRRDDRSDRWDERRDYRQDRREYREFRQRFNSEQWRRNWHRNNRDDWWRTDRRFRGYSGLRIGFYFAPGYGYYQVPRNYWGQRYHVGQHLPSIFWRYQLNEWRTYGLGYPPPGTQWVLVDNHIYLIDHYDGYIIDVIFDAWRW